MTAENVLPPGTAVHIASGATLDLGNVNQQVIGSLLGTAAAAGGTVTTSSTGCVTLTIAGADGHFQRNAPGRLRHAGLGHCRLGHPGPRGRNTYTGGTQISGGVLVATNLANGGSPSSIGASTNNAANLVIDGGTLQYIGGGAQHRPALHGRSPPRKRHDRRLRQRPLDLQQSRDRGSSQTTASTIRSRSPAAAPG